MIKLIDKIAKLLATQMEKLSMLEGYDEASSLSSIKNYLMASSDRSDNNLYDHLTNVIAKIIELRPSNPVGK
jgi:capsid protein